MSNEYREDCERQRRETHFWSRTAGDMDCGQGKPTSGRGNLRSAGTPSATAELAARERRIRIVEEALRILQVDRYGASREKLTVTPGQSELFTKRRRSLS